MAFRDRRHQRESLVAKSLRSAQSRVTLGHGRVSGRFRERRAMSDRPLAKKKAEEGRPAGAGRPVEHPAAPAARAGHRGPRQRRHQDSEEGGAAADLHPRRGPSAHPRLGPAGRTGGLAAMLRLAVREAPAWLVSMVVHTVTLVAMAMAAVPGPANYRPQQRLVVVASRRETENRGGRRRGSRHAAGEHARRGHAGRPGGVPSRSSTKRKSAFDPSEELAAAEKGQGTGTGRPGTAGPAGAEASGDYRTPPRPRQ